MKLFFDTSVLVAALVEPHPHHQRALPWLQATASGTVTSQITWHAVAETWSVLTRLPGGLRLPPATARLMVERVEEQFRPVEVNAAIYRAAIRRCAERGMRSGALFDALHLVAAESHQADALVTFNREDFDRLYREGSTKILVPPDPPSLSIGA